MEKAGEEEELQKLNISRTKRLSQVNLKSIFLYF